LFLDDPILKLKFADSKGELLLKETGLSWLTLIAASSTLVCCALPIILATPVLGEMATVLIVNLLMLPVICSLVL
jgi:hypothetical protein